MVRESVGLTRLRDRFQLAFAWLSDYDGFDIAALTLLSHGPYVSNQNPEPGIPACHVLSRHSATAPQWRLTGYFLLSDGCISATSAANLQPQLYLLNSFYGLTTLTAGASLGIDVLSSFIPFLLLRPLSGARSAAANAPYREIIVDRNLQGSTTLLAAVVYSTTLFIASKLVLPTTLVLYFEGIPSIQSAVDATLLGNVPSHVVGLLFGVASRIFIFTPVAATGRTTEDAEVAKFDPVGATLGETLYWNLWGFTTRSKVAIRRTVVAMFVTGINTFSQCRTLHGVEFVGAAIYAAVWVLGTMLTGLSLAYVGVV